MRMGKKEVLSKYYPNLLVKNDDLNLYQQIMVIFGIYHDQMVIKW